MPESLDAAGVRHVGSVGVLNNLYAHVEPFEKVLGALASVPDEGGLGTNDCRVLRGCFDTWTVSK